MHDAIVIGSGQSRLAVGYYLRRSHLRFMGYGNWTGFASAMLIGVGRKAARVVKHILERLEMLSTNE